VRVAVLSGVVTMLLAAHVIDASAIVARPIPVVTVAPSYYAPLIVVVHRGMSLLLVQADPTQRHDVVSRAVRSDRRPLFASARSLGFGEAALVPGVESLPSGAYPFTCTIHPFMFGQLIVES
jgi:hypothetical protein